MRTELETSRLFMHSVEATDFAEVYAVSTNEFARKYLFDDQLVTPEQVRDYLQTNDETFASNGYGLWLLHEKATDQMIGLVGLWSFFNEPQPQLLYALYPSFTGRGYATESATSVLQYGFTNLSFSYIDASLDEPNVASHRVIERLNMTLLKKDVVNGNPILFYRKETSAVA